MITTDPKAPCLNTPKGEGEQNECYLILSEEERAKGFVRPFRESYIHIGKDVKSHWKRIHRMIDEDERNSEDYQKYIQNEKYFVAVMTILEKEDGSFKGGSYVTQEELDAWGDRRRIGGCGGKTTMTKEIAETYARDPGFYGSTWCMNCRTHIHVGEFVWDDETGETVGS